MDIRGSERPVSDWRDSDIELWEREQEDRAEYEQDRDEYEHSLMGDDRDGRADQREPF